MKLLITGQVAGLWLSACFHCTSVMAADWDYFAGDQAGSKYSTLKQIDTTNVEDLQQAWTYRTGDMQQLSAAHIRQVSTENTPVLLKDTLIVCTPTSRLIALDPASGKEKWTFDPNPETLPDILPFPKCRGVSHWLDDQADEGSICRHRIIYSDWRFRAIAVDVRTGKRCEDFGDNGMVQFESEKQLLPGGEFMFSPSPPAVIGEVAIFGSMIFDNVRQDAPSGKVRAISTRTGERLWEFDPIPRDPDDPVAHTWQNDSATYTGHSNVWSIMSVDEERGLVFLPTTSPSTDFYGGERPGENRHGNSVVALRGETGELVWAYQIVHHDVWDYDLPAQPILVDLPVDDEVIPALIQITKQGLIFTLNRETGEPVFPVEERPVPQNGVEGEWLSPTQPIPVKPPPLVKLGFGPDDAWGFTPIDRYFCKKEIESYRHDGFYAPPSLEGTIVMPGFSGGPNWGGGAYDRENHLLVVPTLHMPIIARLVPRKNEDGELVLPEMDAGVMESTNIIRFPQEGTPYLVENFFVLSPLGVPCSEPPWGRLSAVDMVNGTIKWQVALGSLEKLMPLPVPVEWGPPNAGGAIVTAGGLVFIAASNDDKFRAFDIQTGEKLWETKLPAGGQANPMTYAIDGQQYVVIVSGGHAIYQSTPGDYVIAYTLKDD